MVRLAPIALVGSLAGCGISGSGPRCGIVSLAGPTLLLEEFTKPGKTLAAMPEKMPEILVVRLVVGQAQRGILGKTDTGWVIGVDGALPPTPVPGFGVLLDDSASGPRGVLLYEGAPIPGAPILGTVQLGTRAIPLIGLTTSAAAFQDTRCPLFPDSLRR